MSITRWKSIYERYARSEKENAFSREKWVFDAIRKGKVALASYLLEEKVDINKTIKGNGNYSIIGSIVIYKRVELVEAALKNPLDPNALAKGTWPLDKLVFYYNFEPLFSAILASGWKFDLTKHRQHLDAVLRNDSVLGFKSLLQAGLSPKQNLNYEIKRDYPLIKYILTKRAAGCF